MLKMNIVHPWLRSQASLKVKYRNLNIYQATNTAKLLYEVEEFRNSSLFFYHCSS